MKVYSVRVWPEIRIGKQIETGPLYRAVFKDLDSAKRWGEKMANLHNWEGTQLVEQAFKTAKWYDAPGVVSNFCGLGDENTGIDVIRIYHDEVQE